MGQAVNADQIREMLRVAALMRSSAKETRNERYIQMFVRTAKDLEERATLIAGDPTSLPTLQKTVYVTCP
jgi:hypothetical protein